MAAAAILVFEKFEILTICPLLVANLRHSAKFHQNRSKVKRLRRYGDLTVFKMAAVRHLGFLEIQIFLPSGRLRDPFCIIVPNFAKIGQSIAVISRFLWICRARIGTTREDYLVVFIVEQNLVGIAAVLWMI